jgi:hypothetical protein
MDRAKFEDECRQLMGTGSYLLFTLDRVVNHAVKQLQSLVSDPVSVKLRVRVVPPPYPCVCPHLAALFVLGHLLTLTPAAPAAPSPCVLQSLFVHQQRRSDLLRATLPPAQLPAAMATAASDYKTSASALLLCRGEDCFRATFSRPTSDSSARVTLLVMTPTAGPSAVVPTVTDDDEEMK